MKPLDYVTSKPISRLMVYRCACLHTAGYSVCRIVSVLSWSWTSFRLPDYDSVLV